MLSLKTQLLDYLRGQEWMAGCESTITEYVESARLDGLLLGETLLKRAPDNAVVVVLPSYASAIICAHFALPLLDRPIVWLATNGGLSLDQCVVIHNSGLPAVFVPSCYWWEQWYGVVFNERNPLNNREHRWTIRHDFVTWSNYNPPTEQQRAARAPIQKDKPTQYLPEFAELGSVHCDLSFICRLPAPMRDAFIAAMWGDGWALMKFNAMAQGWEPIDKPKPQQQAEHLTPEQIAARFPDMPPLNQQERDWLREHREDVDYELAMYCNTVQQLGELVDRYSLEYTPTALPMTQRQVDYLNYHLKRNGFGCRV